MTDSFHPNKNMDDNIKCNSFSKKVELLATIMYKKIIKT
jgi:hypothetical protein